MKFICIIKNCVYVSNSRLKFRCHIVNHSPDDIYDYAFENGLLSGNEANDTFQRIVNCIMVRGLSK